MVQPPKTQLLKWIGNKQRFARRIVSFFPEEFGAYYEPFLGSGAVLATLARENSVGADSFAPLIEIWKTLAEQPSMLKQWYEERWHFMMKRDRKVGYETIKASYSLRNPKADFTGSFLAKSR